MGSTSIIRLEARGILEESRVTTRQHQTLFISQIITLLPISGRMDFFLGLWDLRNTSLAPQCFTMKLATGLPQNFTSPQRFPQTRRREMLEQKWNSACMAAT